MRDTDLSPHRVLLSLHFWSSLWAAVDSAVVVSPFSIRVQNQAVEILDFLALCI